MRNARLPALRPVLALALALCLAAAPRAQARKPAPGAAPAGGESVGISGRVAVGLDKTFIKDPAQGYFMVQGADLSRHAGRLIEAKGLVVGREQEYRVVRLLEFRVKNPDDDSPGAGGTAAQGRPDAGAGATRRKK